MERFFVHFEYVCRHLHVRLIELLINFDCTENGEEALKFWADLIFVRTYIGHN
jgi:hypothetical protein